MKVTNVKRLGIEMKFSEAVIVLTRRTKNNE